MEALQIALDAIRGWLEANGDRLTVYLTLMDAEVYAAAMDAVNEGMI